APARAACRHVPESRLQTRIAADNKRPAARGTDAQPSHSGAQDHIAPARTGTRLARLRALRIASDALPDLPGKPAPSPRRNLFADRRDRAKRAASRLARSWPQAERNGNR